MSTDVRQERARHQGIAADLPFEGSLPSFEGATTWLNSPPLTPAGLRGKVVLAQFWTYTCINWRRTHPYVRAWARHYKDGSLVVISVHTPEFAFEHDLDNVKRQAPAMQVDWPIAVDNDYEVWRAFANHYWPALYFVDADGRIRHHRFGEGDYERSEMVIRQLLAAAGAEVPDGMAEVEATGPEVEADFQPRPAETQPLVDFRRLDGQARCDRPAQAQRADRLPVPRPRRAPGHGPGGEGRQGAISRPARRRDRRCGSWL